MMKTGIRVAALALFFLYGGGTRVRAQLFPAKNYPQGYFAYPVGATVGLAANFGELRPNHWHMGLDCRTNQKENLPVYAAAEGFIAKIKIEPFGFGRAIYIQHPNGFTTLYAHLNDFFPELEKWVREQQYKRESWKMSLDSIPANLFPVTRGQFIAQSGNTGGSQGPHLHFEIRDTKTDKVLNPLLFGFIIPDAVPPKILRLAIYDRCKSVYEQTPLLLPLKLKNGEYHIPGDSIKLRTEKVSFAISATDAVNGSANPNGIYEAVVFDNEQPLCGFQLDGIGYNETRYLNAHIDHKMKTNGGAYVQHLSQLPGYFDGVYKKFNGDGVVNIFGGQKHVVKIVVKDAAGNNATLVFTVSSSAGGSETSGCNDSLLVQAQKIFYPNLVNVFDQPGIFFYTSAAALYDSVAVKYARLKATQPLYFSDIHQVHTPAVPVHDYFTVNLQPTLPVPAGLREKLLIRRTYTGGKSEAAKAKWRGDWLSAPFRGFGSFAIVADTLPPVITPVGIKPNAVLSKATGFSFVVTDNYEDLDSFTALLDGQWLLFSNDKGKVFRYRFDEHCAPGPHELKITAVDMAGNKTERVINFVR